MLRGNGQAEVFFIEQLHLLYFTMTKMDLIRSHLCFQLNNALCLLLEPFGEMEVGWCCSEAAFDSSGLTECWEVLVLQRVGRSQQGIHAVEFLK